MILDIDIHKMDVFPEVEIELGQKSYETLNTANIREGIESSPISNIYSPEIEVFRFNSRILIELR